MYFLLLLCVIGQGNTESYKNQSQYIYKKNTDQDGT